MLRSADLRSAAWLVAGTGSALLVRATMPPYDVAPLALVAWVPLLVLVGRVTLRYLLLAATIQGALLNLWAHAWVVGGLAETVSAPLPAALGAWILLAIFQGLRVPLVLFLVHLAVRVRCPLWLAFPVVELVLEEFYPLFFPWTLALEVHGVAPWLQLAALGGPGAVSVWLGLVNGLVADAWRGKDERALAVRRLAAAGGVVASVSAFGYWALAEVDAREAAAPSARVLVGHFGTESAKRGAEPVVELRHHTLDALRRSGPVELVIWPETVVSRPTDPRELPKLARDFLLRDRAAGTGAPVLRVPLLFGAVLEDADRKYNAAVLVRHPGVVLGRYDKQVLVPVGESSRIASALPDFGELVPVATRFASGAAPSELTLDGRRISVSICYEDILAEHVRQSVLATEPELLVNLTSDAWFRGSAARDFHFALAKLRSVEQRKYLVRSTREGVSAVIDSGGRVLERTGSPSSEVLSATVRWLPGLTPYARFGATWIVALVLLTGVVVLVRARGASR
ncbi:MAG TPA: apolipoprotein N-acyltransferase [Polyangiaceae bacterium]